VAIARVENSRATRKFQSRKVDRLDAAVYAPLFVAATVVTSALGIVFLVRGLRATTRQGVGERSAWCFLMAIVQGGAVVATYLAGLTSAFAAVAGTDPSRKAALLSEHISRVTTIGSIGVLTTLPPFVFAVVLFVRRYRFPAAP
jgi:hypothetical protein